jgi:uncharacterized protein YndB with AHSA1/START domain
LSSRAAFVATSQRHSRSFSNKEEGMDDFTPLIRVSEIVDTSPSDVWQTATRKTGLMFMGSDVKTDWQEGHPITFNGEWKGKPFEDKGLVEAFEPEKKLAFTHFSPMSGKPDSPENYNLVSIELEPKGDQTDVTLTQSIHRDAERPPHETIAEFEKNWRMMLGKLKQEAEKAPAPA